MAEGKNSIYEWNQQYYLFQPVGSLENACTGTQLHMLIQQVHPRFIYHSHLYRVRKQDAWLSLPPPLLDRSFTAQEQAPSRAYHPKLALSEATTALRIPLSWSQPNHPFLQIMHPPAWLFFPCAPHWILPEKCLVLTKQTLYLPNGDIINYPCSMLMRTGSTGL